MSKEKHRVQIKELTVHYRYRSEPAELAARPRFSCPRDATQYLEGILSRESVEVFLILCLTTKHSPIAYHELSRGTLDATLVHPREVFKVAFLANAACLILGHNHPSRDPTPSAEDLSLTKTLVEAGSLLGVKIIDHIIIGRDGRYHSFRERGLLE